VGLGGLLGVGGADGVAGTEGDVDVEGVDEGGLDGVTDENILLVVPDGVVNDAT
jgi:hypothetical protein